MQVKRTLLILDISLICCLRQLVREPWHEGVPGRGGGDSHGSPVDGNRMGVGRAWTKPFPNHLENFLLPLPSTHLTSITGGGVGAAAEKGTACIRLSEFYIGHKVRQLEKFTRRWQEGWEGHWEKTKEQTGVNM